MIYGERLQQKRKSVGLTQEALAKALGVQRNTVWRWEKGKAVPDMATVTLVAKLLNTSVPYLTGETDNPAAPNSVETLEGSQLRRIAGRVVELPLFSITACMGAGFDNEGEPWEKTGTIWVEERVAGPLGPALPYFINADGDSMEPQIYEGDRLLVNENVMPGQGDICLARYTVNGWLRDVIKYYYPRYDGGFILRSSETSGIPPLEFTCEQKMEREAFVVGRIMYIDRGEAV